MLDRRGSRVAAVGVVVAGSLLLLLRGGFGAAGTGGALDARVALDPAADAIEARSGVTVSTPEPVEEPEPEAASDPFEPPSLVEPSSEPEHGPLVPNAHEAPPATAPPGEAISLASELAPPERERSCIELGGRLPVADPALDGFGSAMATDGERVVIGDSHWPNPWPRPVRVYTMRDGAWKLERSLPSQHLREERTMFGMALALSGDSLAITMQCRSGHGVFHEVEVHRCLDDGSTRLESVLQWKGPVRPEERFPPETSPIVPELHSDQFAPILTLEGDTLVAVGTEIDAYGKGLGVRIFEREGERWQLAAAQEPLGTGYMPGSVALRDGRLAVGAYSRTRAADGYAGAVLLYRREGGSWIEERRWRQLASADLGYFGASVAWTPHGLAVGSPAREDGDRGTVVLLDEADGEWQVQQVLRADPDLAGFGWSLAADGDRLAVGVPRAGAGAVVLFHFSGWRYEECGRWLAPGPGVGVGASLAFVADQLVVGRWMPDCHDRGDGVDCLCRYGSEIWVSVGGGMSSWEPGLFAERQLAPPSLVDAARGALSPYWLDLD